MPNDKSTEIKVVTQKFDIYNNETIKDVTQFCAKKPNFNQVKASNKTTDDAQRSLVKIKLYTISNLKAQRKIPGAQQ